MQNITQNGRHEVWGMFLAFLQWCPVVRYVKWFDYTFPLSAGAIIKQDQYFIRVLILDVSLFLEFVPLAGSEGPIWG
jgi:hypothetical protein